MVRKNVELDAWEMKRVVDPIRVEAVPNSDEWILLEPFKWHVGDKNSEEIIIVPENFRTDFASIPRPVRAFINPVGRIKPAALVHDFLYSLRGKYEDRVYSRGQVDKIFLKIMEAVEMPWHQRTAAYAGVCAGGWIYWNKKP